MDQMRAGLGVGPVELDLDPDRGGQIDGFDAAACSSPNRSTQAPMIGLNVEAARSSPDTCQYRTSQAMSLIWFSFATVAIRRGSVLTSPS
jgi:hypothetical protein